nr:hypothetical protein MBKG4397_8520 [Mycoplasmopsis bovis]
MGFFVLNLTEYIKKHINFYTYFSNYISDFINYKLTNGEKIALISYWRDYSKENNKKYLNFCKILEQFEKKLQEDVHVDFWTYYEFEILESLQKNKNIQELIYVHFKDNKLFQNIYKEFELFKQLIIKVSDQLHKFKDVPEIRVFLSIEYNKAQSTIYKYDIPFSNYINTIAHQFITYKNNENEAKSLAIVLEKETIRAHDEIIKECFFQNAMD